MPDTSIAWVDGGFLPVLGLYTNVYSKLKKSHYVCFESRIRHSVVEFSEFSGYFFEKKLKK